jgi:hypothetical protein
MIDLEPPGQVVDFNHVAFESSTGEGTWGPRIARVHLFVPIAARDRRPGEPASNRGETSMSTAPGDLNPPDPIELL